MQRLTVCAYYAYAYSFTGVNRPSWTLPPVR